MILKSYAKVNLHLEVLGLRRDGYHDIDTLFQTINLYDTLHFYEATQEGAFELKCNIPGLSTGDNIIWKAIESLRSYFPPNSKGLKIVLEKRIPMGAGLGGGSSNGAMVLRGLNQYYHLNMDNNTLMELASRLGADVPFFVKGGLARGQGMGERLTHHEELFCPIHFLVIYPNIHIVTKDAYGDLELDHPRDEKDLNNLMNGLKSKDLSRVADSLFNRFEDKQFRKYPMIKDLKDQLLGLGALGALMSGSGSTVFGIFESRKEAQEAMDHFPDSPYTLFLAESITY
ncbi:MAG: 4-diphosphocytidyl-2-C-methyl-D-erythritol kinase [bacterium]|nr:MAG: 4-diphosphocytidyl-2-C-methyl-D-erythritol kinase [bacterium]